jgi:hypothetical protein
MLRPRVFAIAQPNRSSEKKFSGCRKREHMSPVEQVGTRIENVFVTTDYRSELWISGNLNQLLFSFSAYYMRSSYKWDD